MELLLKQYCLRFIIFNLWGFIKIEGIAVGWITKNLNFPNFGERYQAAQPCLLFFEFWHSGWTAVAKISHKHKNFTFFTLFGSFDFFGWFHKAHMVLNLLKTHHFIIFSFAVQPDCWFCSHAISPVTGVRCRSDEHLRNAEISCRGLLIFHFHVGVCFYSSM